jgi:hypothetical protein
MAALERCKPIAVGSGPVHVLKPDWIKDAPAYPSAGRAKISKATKERWAKFRAAKAKGKL